MANRRVLFLLGTDYVPVDSLRQIYQSLFCRFRDAGWSIAVKGHPNPQFNDEGSYEARDVKVISAKIPAESLCNEYALAIGCFSTALLKFNDAISVLGMDYSSPKVSKMEQQKRIIYLKSQRFFKASQITFPASEVELNALLIRIIAEEGLVH